ncbi:hypothetical protein [Paenibacillus sp. FSL L8-0638]|uniref:hypothetical protein n=1 Tax=Paenibacillus TaxID=44249 RepID=UPI003158B3CA
MKSLLQMSEVQPPNEEGLFFMVKKQIDQSKMSHLLWSLGRFHQIAIIMTQL